MRLPRHRSTPSVRSLSCASTGTPPPVELARRAARFMPWIVAALVGALATPVALAQYKWVGAGGTVTYSDLPPPPGVQATTLTRKGSTAAAGEAPLTPEGGLPGAVRTAATKYPVVLYTTRDCAPCQQARAHLQQRGVPFAERTIESQQDAQAFKRLGFTEPSVPAIAVGRERLTGFEPEQWRRLLDAAQYPASSKLPAGYRGAPAQRLASASAVRNAQQDSSGVQAVESAAPSDPAGDSQVAPLRTRAATLDASASVRPSASTLRF